MDLVQRAAFLRPELKRGTSLESEKTQKPRLQQQEQPRQVKTKRILYSEKVQKPRLQQQEQSGHFVPRLKSPVKNTKPRDGPSSKVKQLLENQREPQQQFFHQQYTTIHNNRTTASDSPMMQQQQLQQHDPLLHYQQRLASSSQNYGFLKQSEKRESEVIEAEMRRLRVYPQMQEPQPPRTPSQLFESLLKSSVGSKQNEPNNNLDRPVQKNSQQHRQSRMLTATKTIVSFKNNDKQLKPSATRKSKKIVPARKRKPAAKRRPQKGKSEKIPLASMKPPPPIATPPLIEMAQKKPDSTPKVDNTSATENELDEAASILLELTLATPPPILETTYPIGTRTKKYFTEFLGWFQGTIRSYNKETKFYSVEYEDNDVEELEHDEIDTGSLPLPKYDNGTQYDIYFFSKQSGKKIGWFVGAIQSKYFHDPKHGSKNGRRTWRYNVVYSDGDSEDVAESYITRNIAKSKQKQKEDQMLDQETDESLSDDDSESSDESSSSSSDDLSSQDDPEYPNPKNIPYWSGKQHHQFISGLQKYGLGNLEDIHEAGCIPNRSFRELVRYWYWYVSDLKEKGLGLNYEARGTVNGKMGRRISIEDDEKIDEEEKKEGSTEDRNSEGFKMGKWSAREQDMVAKAFAYDGSSYKAMSDFMKTRSADQISSYFNRNKKKIVKLSQKYAHEAPVIVPSDKGDAKSKIWTSSEHAILVEALIVYGHDNKGIEAYMKSRKITQISGYMKRNRGAIEKEVAAKERLFKKQFPKKSHAWTSCEHSRLVEGHAIFEKDFKRITDYVKTRTENQVRSILEANPSQYEDESAFDLGDYFCFPIELYHVLNVAPFEGFCRIVSWNDAGNCVLIHDKGT